MTARPAKKKTAPARHGRAREVANDGRPSPGGRAGAGAARDPLADGATTTVATGPANHAIHLLQGEHRTVDALFDRAAGEPRVTADIRRELQRHAQLEEEIFYPALAKASGEGDAAVREARSQHGAIKNALGADGIDLDARRLATLRAAVELHVEFEENVVFAEAQRVFDKDALVKLAERMEQRNRELGGTLPLARPRKGKGAGEV